MNNSGYKNSHNEIIYHSGLKELYLHSNLFKEDYPNATFEKLTTIILQIRKEKNKC